MLDLTYENNYLSNRDNYSDIKLLMRLLGNNNYDLVSRLHNLIVLKKSNISKDDLQENSCLNLRLMTSIRYSLF